MPLCKWYTFWMGSCLICYFIVILFYIEGKWLVTRNLATILPSKSILSGKFQRFNVRVAGTEMLKNSWIYKNFNQNEHFKNILQAQTASRLKEIIQPLPPSPTPRADEADKIFNVSGTKKFLRRYTEIYRHLPSKFFKNAVLGRKEIVQCKFFFWHQT